MTKPPVGTIFINPRGNRYEVVGHMYERDRVVVRDKSGMCDLADWRLMVPENGWQKVEVQ